MKRPTQVDVARLAGVSRATVSFVLNQQKEGRAPILDETQQRLRETAKELGYEPDARAQFLRSGSTRTLGLLIPDSQSSHFWQIIQSVTQKARDAGCELLFSGSDLDREKDSLKSLAHRRVDGLIFLAAFDEALIDAGEYVRSASYPAAIFAGNDAFMTRPRGKCACASQMISAPSLPSIL